MELSALGDRQIQTSGTWSQRCNFWNSLAHTLTRIEDECEVKPVSIQALDQTFNIQDRISTVKQDKSEWSNKKVSQTQELKNSSSQVLQDLDVPQENRAPR